MTTSPLLGQMTATGRVGAPGRRERGAMWLASSLLVAFTGHNRLSPGRYQLTIEPTDGRSRAIYLNGQR